MSKKEQLFKVLEDGKYFGCENFAVKIETKGSIGKEIIINPMVNYEEKKAYYDKAYNDDLILKSYDGIKIVSACCFDKDTEFREIVTLLYELF